MENSQIKLDERLLNKWWRITHLYKIKNKSGQLVNFNPNVMQLEYWHQRGDHRYNAILKARQFGFTTDACIDLLDEALWVPGMSCAIITHEKRSNEEIFQIIKRAFTNLPDLIKPETKTDTLRMYRFTHLYTGEPLDTSIYVSLKLRSGTVRKLHISESAYIKDRGELIAGSKQTVPKDGYITEETTGNGYEAFYDFYMTHHNNPNPGPMDYKTYFFPWYMNPEYSLDEPVENKTETEVQLQQEHGVTDKQLAWRRWKERDLKLSAIGAGLTGEQLFKQEYPSTIAEAFQSGVGNVFNAEKLDATEPAPALKNPRITEGSKDKELQPLVRIGVNFWHLPETGKNYVIGVDPSDGAGADFSCVDVWEKETMVQVAQYYGKLRPDELSELTKDIAVFYNKAYVGVENNMLTTILFLSKIYDNYYYDTRIDEKTLKRTKKLGWNTNIKTRDVMIDEFAIMFDQDHLTINSSITLAEMRTFVKKENGKREHADGKHDDALFAGMIANQMRKMKPRGGRVFATNPL